MILYARHITFINIANYVDYSIYRVSVKKGRSRGWEHGRVKENKKVLYHFANFAIVYELIIRNRRLFSLSQKIKFSSGTEKCFMYMYVCMYVYTCIHACTEKYPFYCLQKLTQFTFFF